MREEFHQVQCFKQTGGYCSCESLWVEEWMTGWLVGRSVSCIVGQSVKVSIGLPLGQFTDWLVCWMVGD